MKRLLLYILIGIFLISLTSATVETLGIFEKEKCIDLKQAGVGLTGCNITSVAYPNSTKALSLEVVMTANGNEFNYTYCDTTPLGQYIVTGFCTNTTEDIGWVYDFEVTYTGLELTQAKSLMYIGLLALLVFLFVINIFMIPMLPGSDDYDEEGTLLSINQLKYVRPILYGTAWFLMIGICFIASNISFAYLGTDLIGKIFFILYEWMFRLVLPFIFIWFAYIVYSIWKDKQMQSYLERGIITDYQV